MNTQGIMNLALVLSGFDKVPADSRIYNPGDNIERILFGIDIRDEDLFFAKQQNFDLVISHHPPYYTHRSGFFEVLNRHRELMEDSGVDSRKAQQASDKNKVYWQSFFKSIDRQKTFGEIALKAKELDTPLMNIHLPCDEIGRRILQDKADQLGPNAEVSTLMALYSYIPEIHNSAEKVSLVCGAYEAKTGKVVVIHGAGANGGYPVANALFEVGIDTVVYIHLFSEEHAERLKQENKGNLIITGHYGSDSIGINPLIDKLEDRDIEVVCCNKLIRVPR